MAKKKPGGRHTPRATSRTPKARQRRSAQSQVLPGLEQVRNGRLDRTCEALGDIRDTLNQSKAEESRMKQAAIQEMSAGHILTYKHAGIELVLVPGADNLRVHVIKQGTDVDVRTDET